jgi:hypothetical protein
MDKIENSSRADSWPPWADLTSVSLRRCEESNTLQNVAHKMCTPHMVSTRNLGHYAWGCISGILSPEYTWGYGDNPSNLRLCDAGVNSLDSATKRKREKGTLRTYITAQNACVTRNKRNLKRPISQHEIQSHIIAYQAFGDSCSVAWTSSTEYQILPRPVRTHSAVHGHLS